MVLPLAALYPVNPAWLLLAFAVFLIGITKSGFGSGMGLIVVPLATLALVRLPPGQAAALGLILPLMLTGDIIAITQYRRLLNARLLKRLALPTFIGLLIGSVLLFAIHRVSERSTALAEALIRLEIGGESVFLVSLHYYGRWRSRTASNATPTAQVVTSAEPTTSQQALSLQPSSSCRAPTGLLPEPLRSYLAGSYSGISSTLAHAAGPVIALYLLPLKLPRQTYVGTCAAYFAALNAAKLPAYYAAGQFAHVPARLVLAGVPVVLLGAATGRWLVKHIPDKAFQHIVYTGAGIMGVYLLIDGARRIIPHV